jgi:hypothetical protein
VKVWTPVVFSLNSDVAISSVVKITSGFEGGASLEGIEGDGCWDPEDVSDWVEEFVFWEFAMGFDKEEQQSDDQYNNSVLELIYEDANDSFKVLRDDINSINTRLTLLIGFNATFASLLPRLPIQSLFSLKYQLFREFDDLYPYAKLCLGIPISVVNWLLTIKPLIALLLGTSVSFAILSVLPSSTPIVLLPKKMLEKGKGCSEEAFRIGVIRNRDETIQRLQSLISQKASNLKFALVTLGCAALLTVIDILINSNIQLN